MLLFQQLPIIGFVAPHLLKWHMVLTCDLAMVSSSNMKKNAGVHGIDLAACL